MTQQEKCEYKRCKEMVQMNAWWMRFRLHGIGLCAKHYAEFLTLSQEKRDKWIKDSTV